MRARYDLCIIGSGVAGALLAAEATRRGRTVAIIEAGSRMKFQDRLEFLRRYQTMGGNYFPWEIPGRDAYEDSSAHAIGIPYPLESKRMKAVGGTTLHWGARIQRLMPSDFRNASVYGMGTDWPLSYEDLEPYYSEADWRMGVAGSHHESQPRRSRAYPMPAFPLSVDEQFWLPRADLLGIEVHASAFAINSTAFAGRSECKAFAACHQCPSGARYSADFHLDEAEASGLCDVVAECVARRVEMNAAGEVRAVHATTMAGKDLEFKARQFVIAAHAVESARLLLLSKCGNRSGHVGRHFMEHVYTRAGGYFLGQRFFPGRVGYEKLESLSFYDGPERHERGAIKLEFVFQENPLQEMHRHRLWGLALARRDKERFGHWLGIDCETEMQANPDSRITLDERKRDVFGDPVPHVHMKFNKVDLHTQARAKAIGAEILSSIGAREIEQNGGLGFFFAGHQMGTCRMSSDPDKGVVDQHLRVHEASNLYVVGSSVFPTSGAAQPTLTIAALSLRLADHLMRS